MRDANNALGGFALGLVACGEVAGAIITLAVLATANGVRLLLERAI